MTTTSHPTSDREALSALFDGELTGDAARFALKRLDHDQEWRLTCERWRVVGEALRGQGTLLPATFPSRVRDAMRAEVTVPARAVDSARWTRPRWSSVALAASAAMVAFFLARSPVDTDTPASTSPQVASAMQGAPAPEPQAPATQAPQTPQAPSVVDAASAAVAVASVARPSQRARNLQRDRAATDRIVSSAVAAQTAVTGEAPATVLVSQPTESTPLATPASPFSGTVESRPWPRAVLPQYSGNGTLAADYATAPSFYPFSPSHPPASVVPADDPQPAPTQP